LNGGGRGRSRTEGKGQCGDPDDSQGADAGKGKGKGGTGVASLGVDFNLLVLLAVLAVLSAVALGRGGTELLADGLTGGASLLLRFALVITISFLVAGLAEKLVPREWVEAALGDEAGLRGILLATAAGAITPAGPFVSMPIAATMLRSGAGSGAVVAFVTSWSVLALHRFVAWEVPILGLRFALIRYAASLLLPVIAGLLVRALSRS